MLHTGYLKTHEGGAMYRVDPDIYQRALAGAAVVPLADWSVLRVRGDDRREFLNKFCTNDLKPLAAGQGCETLFTDVKGKILAGVIALIAGDSVELWAVPGQADGLIAHLDRYCIREDVQFADATGDARLLLVAGNAALATVATASGIDPSEAPAERWDHADATIGDAAVRVVHCPVLGAPAWLVRCECADVDAVLASLQSAGAEAAGDDFFHTLRIEAGWPLYGADYTHDNLPQEVGRDAALINLRKGCYLGQETVARIDALGHVNRQLSCIRATAANGVLTAEAEVTKDAQVVGRVTSACYSPKIGTPLALAMIRRGSNDPGVKLACLDAEAEVIAAPSS